MVNRFKPNNKKRQKVEYGKKCIIISPCTETIFFCIIFVMKLPCPMQEHTHKNFSRFKFIAKDSWITKALYHNFCAALISICTCDNSWITTNEFWLPSSKRMKINITAKKATENFYNFPFVKFSEGIGKNYGGIAFGGTFR